MPHVKINLTLLSKTYYNLTTQSQPHRVPWKAIPTLHGPVKASALEFHTLNFCQATRGRWT